MEMEQKRSIKLQSILTYACIFIIASGFYMTLAIMLLLLLTLIESFKRRIFLINRNFAYVTVFVVLYCCVAGFPHSFSGFSHTFGIAILFWCTLQLSSEPFQITEEIPVAITTCCGSLFHLVYSLILNFISGYIYTNPYLIDPVTNSYLASTHYSVMLYLPLCLVFTNLGVSGMKGSLKLAFSIITIVSSAICVLMLARRMVLVVIFILILAKLIYNQKTVQYISQSKFVIMFLGITSVCIIILFNWNSISEAISTSYFTTRFSNASLTDSGRFTRVQYYISHFFDHMFGGGHLYAVKGYAHNLWLDIYDEVGIFPLIALIAYSIGTIKTVIRYDKTNFETRNENFFSVSILIVCLIQFFTEPAYYSNIEFVWCFSLIIGSLDAKCDNYKFLTVGARR